MFNKIPSFIIILLFLLGIATMSYPLISNYLAEISQAEVISEYQEEVETLSDEKQQEEREKAISYNQDLIGNIVLTDPFDPDITKAENERYQRILNVKNDGMMGYIEIPSIDVYLPIYHGTEGDVLDKGVGHLMNTSLPIGGEGTHSVLSAHRGLPSAKLFTDLDKVKVKEKFYLRILGEVLAYEINQIKVVEPHNIKDLLIDREQEYVTLVTCTPYGVNSHRILVRGHRVPYTERESEELQALEATSVWRKEYLLALMLGGTVGTITLVVAKARKRKATNEE